MGGQGSGRTVGSKNYQATAPWIDELRELWKKRDPHVQKILEPFFPQRSQFHGTQFIAYIVKDIKQKPSGDAEFTFTVPFEFRDLAFELTDALMVPLSVDVQLWKPFEEASNGSRELAEPPPAGNGSEAAE